MRTVLEIFLVLFSVFGRQKVNINENVSFTDYASGILLQIGHKSKKFNDVTIVDMTSSLKFFDIVLFLLSSLVTGPSFMSILSLVLELIQLSFIKPCVHWRR